MGSPFTKKQSGSETEIDPPEKSATGTSIADAAAPKVKLLRESAELQDRIDRLIHAYRVRGHMAASLDPLGLSTRDVPELNPAVYGIAKDLFDQPVAADTLPGEDVRSVRDVIERLHSTNSRSIGIQFMHIDDAAVREWLQTRMESTGNRIVLQRREQLRILTRLTEAVVFEEFVRKKYVGAKTFSLEGCESLIPLLDLAIEHAGSQGVKEIVAAMAHRGRLSVLVNIMAKDPREVFREFEDHDAPVVHVGDVKYHLGHSSDWETSTGTRVHLSLCFNPSHLEYINPVALGRMRAKQDRTGSPFRGVQSLTLLIHGDAAFAGSGITQETLNLSELEAYTTGGALHVVVNNQIGFTTPGEQARSSLYATGVAKMLQIPIFHVNGEDPEAVTLVTRLALDFRARFHRDVVIDLFGYRRQGHNEIDEPSYTQPIMYEAIRERPSVREGYLDHLLDKGGVTREEADGIAEICQRKLDEAWRAAREDEVRPSPPPPHPLWDAYEGGSEDDVPDVDTGFDAARLSALLIATTRVPDGFAMHPRLKRFVEPRIEMAEGRESVDWSAAEALAFASLAVEGHPVRLTGQDSERGTFSQRHAVLHDGETGERYVPLQHLSDDQAMIAIHNSPLSEAGVLGFEFGYSLDRPEGLVLWEAQYGDFVNAAQVIIDQFVVASWNKWRRLSGLVLLLPHGFEGQGPEHSSARLERFLSLAGADNIQIVNPTTPAQYFHVLRRQVLRRWRKPLVIMTPKSMLRRARAVSSMADLAKGSFERVIPDVEIEPSKARRALLCTGKFYYELCARRRELQLEDVAIHRVEQLYPLREFHLRPLFKGFSPGTEFIWAQEEPANMGAWPYWKDRFCDAMPGGFKLRGVTRPPAASPGNASTAAHRQVQASLIDQALTM